MEKALTRYLSENGLQSLDLKAILFDMDGVLFDSMSNHAGAWYQTMQEENVECEPRDFYMYEGCVASYTINTIFQRQYGYDATPEQIKRIYQKKIDYFNADPEFRPMKGAQELVAQVKTSGLNAVVVTGSGQESLIERLRIAFSDIFPREKVVCAFDVKHGKPDPEPYLKGLVKANVLPSQAIVVENAPMGVKAGKAAGIFTVGVNTGPLSNDILLEYGADVVFSSMSSLHEELKRLKFLY